MSDTRFQTKQKIFKSYRRNESSDRNERFVGKIIPLLPFYSIFSGRKTYDIVTIGAAGWQANTYDWENFRKAMLAVPAVKRRRLENIANLQRLHSKGKEYEFWTCVYNSL